MSETAEQRMEACANHPEKQQIFHLEKMLIEAGYPYYFNFREDISLKQDIEWDTYNFLIEIGRLAGYEQAQISVTMDSEGDRTKLRLLDMRPAGDNPNAKAEDGILHHGLTSEQVMEIVDKYFDLL